MHLDVPYFSLYTNGQFTSKISTSQFDTLLSAIKGTLLEAILVLQRSTSSEANFGEESNGRASLECYTACCQWYYIESLGEAGSCHIQSLFSTAFAKNKRFGRNTVESVDRATILKEDLDRLIASDSSWRVSECNSEWAVCQSYPVAFGVPQRISDTVLVHAAPFRTRNRLPILSYRHASNGCPLVRSAQPMTGWQFRRSVQDEKLVEAIRLQAPLKDLLIVDARPTANALVHTVVSGGGVETMSNASHYKTNLPHQLKTFFNMSRQV